jgi:AraC family transcriptional regulator
MDQATNAGSRLADILAAPPQVSAAWSVFALDVVVEPPRHFAATFSDHALALQTSGVFRARQEIGGRALEGWCAPGCFGIVPANQGMRWDTRGHSGVFRATALFIPEAFFSRVIAQDWEAEPGRVEILWQFLKRDPVAEGVLTSLAFEAENGSPSGQLYAESACEFLAHHVLRSYSSLSPQPSRARGGLAGCRLKVVLDYIHDNLGQPIALRELAELARVSPRHFERAFRQAVGVPPHAYVMERRVEAARQLLINEPGVTVEEIATRVGFSSSSHLAFAFRRQTGRSPVAFRRAHRS